LREALQHRGEAFFDRVTSRCRGNDSPDCEAIGLDGKSIAIEVTELVDPAAIVAFKSKKRYEWSDWVGETLREAVGRLLTAKPSRHNC